MSVAFGVLAISETNRNPNFSRTSLVFGPTPQIALTGKGCKNSITRSGLISNKPFGLQYWLANLAMNLFGPIPTEQVTPHSFSTRVLVVRSAMAQCPCVDSTWTARPRGAQWLRAHRARLAFAIGGHGFRVLGLVASAFEIGRAHV